MQRRSGQLLIQGRFVHGEVSFDDGRITAVEELPGRSSASLPIIAPGLIDLHVHGYGGADPLEDLAAMRLALARAGTTSFQPTLFPEPPALLGEQCEDLWSRAESGRGARVLGIHVEGPFVNPLSAGALPRSSLCEPSPQALRAIAGSSSGGRRGISTMTVAPEIRGALELVDELCRMGIRASLGHSLASADQAQSACSQGASLVTHLFNAMSGFHHRGAGLAGFALTDADVQVELIGDLVHVDRRAIELALAARGPQNLCLVSDGLVGAGTGCDVFESRGRRHFVREGAAYFEGEDGARLLAGSALGQLDMVRRLVREGIVDLEDALTMASASPARALGHEREIGTISPRARADLIVLSPALDLLEVLVAGEAVGCSRS